MNPFSDLSEIQIQQRHERMAVISKRTREFLEQRESPILVGRDDISVLERPRNCDVRVIPANPAIIRWRIIIGDLVHDYHIALQGEVSMCKAHRNIKLSARFGRKFCRNMLPKSRRTASDVHRDIQDLPPQDANQLAWAACGSWKCSPRSVPTRVEIAWLS